MLKLIHSKSQTSDSTFSFLSLGDWGGAALGGQYTTNVNDVAAQLVSTASKYNIDTFLLNTGDNFYWCGIQNTSDYQINTDFVKVLIHLLTYFIYVSRILLRKKPYDELNLPFYSILGNHEYGYNVSAQLDYATMNPKWIMDDRYYTRRFELVTSSGTFFLS